MREGGEGGRKRGKGRGGGEEGRERGREGERERERERERVGERGSKLNFSFELPVMHSGTKKKPGEKDTSENRKSWELTPGHLA